VDSLTVGDGTNNFVVDSNGIVKLEGDARVTGYEWIPSTSLRAGGASPATEDLNGAGFPVLTFDDGQDRYAQAIIKIPSDMDRSEDSYICLGWSSPTTSAYCYWEVEYLITAIDDDDTDTAGSASSQAELSSSTADGLTLSQWTIPAANIGDSDVCLHLKIHRDGNSIIDTLGDIAELHGITFKYTKNSLGE